MRVLAREPEESASPPIEPGTQPAPSGSPTEAVSYPVRLTAAWSWRLLVIAAAVYVLARFIAVVQVVIIPILISFLLSALLQPIAGWLRRRGVPRAVAAVIVVIGGLATVAGTLTVVIRALIHGFADLSDQVGDALNKIQQWLIDGPLHLSEKQINDAAAAVQDALKKNQDVLTSGALDTATTAAHIVGGFFLVIFTTFFFMKDGEQIWSFLLKFSPQNMREAIREGGNRAWRTLISYVRAQVVVAFVDAVGIGLAVYLLGVPLALPLAALVFLGAFIPIVGATLSSIIAILVALVANGPITALFLALLVIAVQQIEGHVLQPLLMGRAVAVHPLAVVLVIAAGLVIAGLVGALIAVPMMAMANTMFSYLASRSSGVPELPALPKP
ncbi:MAG TPA: AI-2E family transporter [Mycobacteriales bacterium]|nr:AI-2E family transporter [Mycobacteriales bacterium]